MASTVEENGTQYASNGTQECSEEQGELTAMHNVSKAIQKYALEAMDMSQLEKLRLKEEYEIFKEFVRKIMEYGGDNYHQIIEKGGLTSLQQRVQEIIKSSEDTTQRQNVSGARFNALKDTATVQSDSHVSNQSKKWEHSGARPKYRPPETDRCPKPSLLNSLKDCILQQVAEPVAQYGVANAFLARHSEDKHLPESLYYNKAEEMLAKDMDSMVKTIDSNKAKPYLGDCQLAAMSDPYYQPYSSAFPLSSEASIRAISEDGFPLDDKFNNSNSVPPPEPSSSYIGANTSQNSYFNSFNPNFGGEFALDTSKPQLLQDGCFTSLQRSDFLQSGFTDLALTSHYLGSTGPQITHSVVGTESNISFTGSTSILALEPLQMQMPSTTNLGLLSSSSGSIPIYGNQANASTGFQTSSSVVRANGSNNRLLSGVEFGRNTGDGMNTSGLRNSSTISTTIGNHLASGTYREGNGAGDSSSSCITSAANTGRDHDKSSVQSGGSVSNGNYGTESVETTDNSLHELKQGVEACAMVERVPRGREEREEFGQEIKRKECEIRAERAHKERERHARELEEARRRPQQQEPVTGQSLWLCEHYQRCCRVCFPCCKNFYSCHHCHNNSMECDNKEARASHATHLKCSYCNYEQKIGEDSAKCRRCGREMSAYFCAICKHFMSIDNNPYHCEKCGICRLYKDKLFHCDVCNVCFNKYFQGKHKCRPDSGHDICCICREDVFYRGFVIFPCSHKVHHECAEAMIQSKSNTCPVCRDPY